MLEDVLHSIEDHLENTTGNVAAGDALSLPLTPRESEKARSSGSSSRKIVPLISSASTSQCPDDSHLNTAATSTAINSNTSNTSYTSNGNSKQTPRSSRSARSTFPSPSFSHQQAAPSSQLTRGDSLSVTTASNNSATNLLRQRMDEIDWYGNCLLHHAFATNDVNLTVVRSILLEAPQLARHRNQFGRIPLHYALDRIRVNVEGLRLLIREYPEGVEEMDSEDVTPYDLAVKWKHSRKIKRLLLDINPSQDYDEYVKLRYGPLGTFAMWASSLGQRYGISGDQQLAEDEEDEDPQEEDNTAVYGLTASVSNLDSVYAFDNSITPRREDSGNKIQVPRNDSVSNEVHDAKD